MVLPSDAARIVLRGDFDIVDDARLTDVFTAVSDAERIVVDMKKVRYIDSTVLNCLVRLQRTRVERGRTPVVLTGLSPHVERIVRIAKVDRVVEIYSGDIQEKHGARTRDVVLVGGWS